MASSGSPLTTLHRWGFGNLKVWASLHKYEKYQQAKIAKNKGWASKLQVGVVRQRRTHSCLTLPSTRGYTIFPSSTEECRKKYTFPKLPSTRENALFTQWYQERGTPFSYLTSSTPRGYTHFSHYVATNAKRNVLEGEIPFLTILWNLKNCKLEKGRHQLLRSYNLAVIGAVICHQTRHLLVPSTQFWILVKSPPNHIVIQYRHVLIVFLWHNNSTRCHIELTELVLEFGRKVKVSPDLKCRF